MFSGFVNLNLENQNFHTLSSGCSLSPQQIPYNISRNSHALLFRFHNTQNISRNLWNETKGLKLLSSYKTPEL